MTTDPSKWEMVDDATAEKLREMSLGQRLSIANDLFQMARLSLWVQAENAHPEWTADQIAREVARQISQGVEPPGCDVAGWFRLNAGSYGEGPWTPDEPIFVVA